MTIEVIGTAEAARILGRSEWTVRLWENDGIHGLKCYARNGRTRLFVRKEVEAIARKINKAGAK